MVSCASIFCPILLSKGPCLSLMSRWKACILARMPGRTYFAPSDARTVRFVFERNGLTRGDLADLMGVSAASITGVVKRLTDSEAIQESGQVRSRGGRKAGQLVIQPDFAHVWAHSMTATHVRSAIVNAWGEIKGSREVRVDSAAQAARALALDSDRGAPRGNPGLLAASVAVPGIPGAGRVSTRWLFHGSEVRLPENCASISAADALLAHFGRQDPTTWINLTLCVDLGSGATATVFAPDGPRIPLDLDALCPDERLIDPSKLPILPNSRSDDPTNVSRISQGERDGDPDAARICDELLASAADFLSRLAQLVRPCKFLIALSDHLEQIIDLEQLKRATRRRCSRAVNDQMSIRLLETNPWTRVSGAGLMTIHNWLVEAERRAVT